jgi:ribonucleotide monophosphatase NagD (HAD superfamily)
MPLGGIRAVLLDLDGTVYEGSRPVAGAAEAVAWLRARSLPLRFTTNTDSVTPAELVARLAGIGVDAAEEEVLTPLVVAAELFARIPGCRVLAVASESVRALLRPRLAGADEAPTHVLVADPSYGAGYAELDAALRALRGGAALVATQMGWRRWRWLPGRRSWSVTTSSPTSPGRAPPAPGWPWCAPARRAATCPRRPGPTR